MELVERLGLNDKPDPDGAPAIGAYLTDGATLFQVQRLLAGRSRHALLMELQDCATLDLILCPVRPLAELGLRLVPWAPSPRA
jgi:hypothetical protein